MELDMDMATGINCARLQANLTARLDAAEAASREAPSDQPLTPLPPQRRIRVRRG